ESAKQSEGLGAEKLLENLIVRSREKRVKLHGGFGEAARRENALSLEEVRCAPCSLSLLCTTAGRNVPEARRYSAELFMTRYAELSCTINFIAVDEFIACKCVHKSART